MYMPIDIVCISIIQYKSDVRIINYKYPYVQKYLKEFLKIADYFYSLSFCLELSSTIMQIRKKNPRKEMKMNEREREKRNLFSTNFRNS